MQKTSISFQDEEKTELEKPKQVLIEKLELTLYKNFNSTIVIAVKEDGSIKFCSCFDICERIGSQKNIPSAKQRHPETPNFTKGSRKRGAKRITIHNNRLAIRLLQAKPRSDPRLNLRFAGRGGAPEIS